MLLKEIVKINEAAIVEPAINFKFMEDADSNLRLCEGFVFNFTPSRPKDSTVGVLNAMRRSFHSQSEPNIHLMVQDYGKGKSHFALALANFFKKEAHSPEVQGIFRQIEIAIAGHSNGLAMLLPSHSRNIHLN